MDRYYQNYPVPGCLSNDEMDDIDNTFCGCFFEQKKTMFLNDLLDLHDLSLSDDSALNELRTAINVYAEENDMLFTEVLDLLKEPS